MRSCFDPSYVTAEGDTTIRMSERAVVGKSGDVSFTLYQSGPGDSQTTPTPL